PVSRSVQPVNSCPPDDQASQTTGSVEYGRKPTSRRPLTSQTSTRDRSAGSTTASRRPSRDSATSRVVAGLTSVTVSGHNRTGSPIGLPVRRSYRTQLRPPVTSAASVAAKASGQNSSARSAGSSGAGEAFTAQGASGRG